MNVSVGLIAGRFTVEVELMGGTFMDPSGKPYGPGRYRFNSEATLTPNDLASCAFALDDVTIGIGFHWERNERQLYRGAFRLVKREAGLTVINDVPLEEYVTSVISSEMSASCPLELLKAHAVISRSWVCFAKTNASPSRQPPLNLPLVRGRDSEPSSVSPPPERGAPGEAKRSRANESASCVRQSRVGGAGLPAGGPGERLDAHEILRWYSREAHADFDVCADDHCQRYQGITKVFSAAAAEAARTTAGLYLRYHGGICDARFSKCCGGVTERYASAWEDRDIPYLDSVYDGPGQSHSHTLETWIRSNPPAYCNTNNSELLSRVLPAFDQETRNFYRWRVAYTPEELADLIRSRLAADLGPIRGLDALARGPSGRIYRLKVTGERGSIIIGKELEIRRALSRTHLYSSAFVVDQDSAGFVLSGAGWGHGVGLCQIGAAVMADAGKIYTEILQHYYRGITVSV